MDLVNCNHGKACYIKTSTKPGPNKGRSFFICGPSTADRCDFVKEAKIPVMLCTQHPGKCIDLQSFSSQNSKNELRRYYRCTVGRESGASWCGHVTVQSNEVMQKENPVIGVVKDLALQKASQEVVKQAKKPLGDHRLPPNVVSNLDTRDSVQKPLYKKDVSDLLTQTKPVPKSDKRPVSSHNVPHRHKNYADIAERVSEKDGNRSDEKCGSSSSSAKIERSMGSRRESSAVILSDNDDTDDDDDDCFIIENPGVSNKQERKDSSVSHKPEQKDSFVSHKPEQKDSSVSHKHVQKDSSVSHKPERKVSASCPQSESANGSTSDPRSVHVADDSQRDAIKQQLKHELMKKRELYQKVDVSCLPDKGARIKDQIKELEKTLGELILDEMKTKQSAYGAIHKPKVDAKGDGFRPSVVPRQTQILSHAVPIPPQALKQMYAANPQAMTLYGGRMTKDRLKQVGAVTTDALERLHKQLETCPNETTESEDPSGLKVQLMSHQRQAIAWLLWREQQEPAGGILADDMGLGKTLTMISLIMNQKERNPDKDAASSEWLSKEQELKKVNKSLVASRATLVVAPASLIHQWNKEIENRCDEGKLKVLVYHGPKRDKDPRMIAKHDVVLTTYSIIGKEVGAPTGIDGKKASAEESVKDEQTGVNEPGLLRIAWDRIILDEGHNIKNHKSLTAMSVCRLRAAHRWVLTGTPIQNDLLDMYSLLRFLRCSPFDEYKVWKKQVEMKSGQGTKRLNILIKSLLLRRTKNQMTVSGKPLVSLPEKKVVNHELMLSTDEKVVYDKIFSQSKNMLQEYLKKQEDKEREKMGYASANTFTKPLPDPGSSHLSGALTLKKDENATGGGSQILLLLLRLRQACCHLSLMKDAFEMDVLEDEGLDVTLEEQMDLMSLSDPKEPKVGLNSLFEGRAVSTKISMLIEKIREIKRRSRPGKPEKSVIVSQWTKMLDIVAIHLKKEGIRFHLIQGNIPPKSRQDMVENFNNDNEGPEVMLLSLRAGGVGLNLIGGNNLFIMDIHWNPALEAQACDRIYRVGQKKDVFIHRFVCKDTVEEKIVALQKKKTDLANNVLTGAGAKRQKLSLNDLKMLFGLEESSNHVPTYSSSTVRPANNSGFKSYNNAPFKPPMQQSAYQNVRNGRPGQSGLYSSNVGAIRQYNKTPQL
ncbi:transcription termination factor 2-like [Tubulanus polymorphus]|uniref:transcription termination factor 2-like n=1 Tax=Tubulanus polymorphus TaxID=672921 RepID=UPI003DA1CC36